MYKRKKLGNGIEVVMEKIPHFRSVSIGLWFRSGSIYEAESQNGLSHFIEHLLFKGTEKRSAKDIALTLDAVGGLLNAFTAKECTCFYSRCWMNTWNWLWSSSVIWSLIPLFLNKRLKRKRV